jgi:hypothetical protein
VERNNVVKGSTGSITMALPEAGYGIPSSTVVRPVTGIDTTVIPTIVDTTLSVALTFNEAGPWVIQATASKSSDVFFGTKSFVVTYTDVAALMIGVLGKGSIKGDVDVHIWMAMQTALDFVSLPFSWYNDLPLARAALFDTAISYLTAALLRPTIDMSGVTAGQVSKVGTGPDTVEYHRLYKMADITAGDDLYAMAWSILMMFTEFADGVDAVSITPFATAGRRGAVSDQFGLGSLSRYNIFTDAVLLYFYGGLLNVTA